ncbi:phosphatidylserine decarboxylase [Rhodovibrionaceae bacterium A322]
MLAHFPYKLATLGLVAGLVLAFSPATQAASPCQGSLEDLQQTYDTDRAFNRLITSTFQNIEPLPPEYGQANPWEGKGFADLLRFLEDWCGFLPTAQGSSDTGLQYIQEFAWLYYLNEYGIRFVKKSPGREILQDFAKQRGAFMDSKASTAVVADWLADVRIEKDDYNLPDPDAPDGGFDSFNAFFSRTLKDQARSRPQTMPERDYIIAAPTDCIMNSIPMVITDGNTLIPTKFRQKLNIYEMLGGSAYAENFIGGTALSCVLMPNTYHRYHSPVNGHVVEAKILEAPYFGYNDFPKWVPINGNVGYHGTDFSEFEDFKRGYFIVDTGLWGHVAFVPVGLDTISSIQFADQFKNITAPVPIKRGDELGHFLYGGSLFLMFFEKDRYQSGAIQVRLGNQIGTFDTKDSKPQ